MHHFPHRPHAIGTCNYNESSTNVIFRQVANGWELKLPYLEFDAQETYGISADTHIPEAPIDNADKVKKEPGGKIARELNVFVFKTFKEMIEFLESKIDESPVGENVNRFAMMG